MRIIFFAILIVFLCSNSAVSSSNPISITCPPVFESFIDLKKIERPSGTVNIRAILVICDHYITPDNNNIAHSLRVDLGTVSQMLEILEKRNIAKVEKTVIQGTNATMANIVKALDEIKTGKDDIILYYFSGHGLMENGKTFMLTADEQNLGRDKVASIIGSKNARLKMLISDCCSNAVDGIAVARSINRSGQKIEAGEFDPIYKDLFLGYEGTMHLNAATEGEFAYSDGIHGGFFTYHLIKEGLIKKPNNSWTDIFNDAKDKTSQMFMRMDADTKAKLASEGIKNQTAKAYSMPKPKTLIKNPVLPTTSIPTKNINIYNFTAYDLPIFLDNNNPSGQWLESNTKEMFVKDAHINESNFSSIAIIDFSTLFLGEWIWDDLGDEVTTTFSTDGFTDVYPDEDGNDRGTWEVRKQEIDGYEYNFITLTYDDDGATLLLDYLIDYDEEFPDEIHLVFVSAFEDGKKMTYEKAEEFLEPSIVMYKIQ